VAAYLHVVLRFRIHGAVCPPHLTPVWYAHGPLAIYGSVIDSHV